MPVQFNAIRTAVAETLEDRKLFSVGVALAAGNLFAFDTADPSATLFRLKVKGVPRGESLEGIDFRPATGVLYAVSDASKLYTIDLISGQATQVGTAPFDPVLNDDDLAIDFNPTADRLRVATEEDQNFRINPDTGAVVDFDPVLAGIQTDGVIDYVPTDPNGSANPDLAGMAYTRDVAGATTAYAIDEETNTLVLIGSVGGTPDSPNNGQLTTVGALNATPVGRVGFDIDTNGATDVALASFALDERSRSSLYTIDLATGAATEIGEIRGFRRAVDDIAIVPAGNTVVAVDAKNRLVTFDSGLPNIATSTVKITGLERREKVVGIDVRPATGGVYAVTNQNRVYTLDVATGAATAVGGEFAVALAPKSFTGTDFNPTVDAIRVVNSAGENLRVNATTGQIVDTDPVLAGTQFDTPLVYASTDVNATRAANISAAAYTNNLVGQTTTTLFAIDATQDTLVTIGSADGVLSPNAGQLFTVGALGLDVRDPVAFDIVTDSTALTNSAFAVFKARGAKASVYSIDLTTGAATAVGSLPKGVVPVGMAVLP